ncbi:MAG: Uma2 family endonuclease [Chloroflexota bacterium]|nr:Uma2 family endonuclease [Chloroflexota bacterium]
MAVATRKITDDEFMQLPETNHYVELIDGAIYEMPSPDLEHQTALSDLHFWLKTEVKTRGGKVYFVPMDVKFDETNTPQPDIFWIAPDGKCRPNAKHKLEGAPDFIAEVLSPSTARRDRRQKYDLYEKYGVREYWLVDPSIKLIEVYSLQAGKFARVGAYGMEDDIASPLWGNVSVRAIFPDVDVTMER